jgi:hypothetical protein
MRNDRGQQEHWALFPALQGGYAIFTKEGGEIMVDAPRQWDSR